MREKNSFVLYYDIYDVVKSLSTEQKGLLFQCILDYQVTGMADTTGDAVVDVAFIPIRQSLDRNNAKWDEIKIKRSEAGKKGMESRYNKGQQKLTKANKTNTETKAKTVCFIPPSIEQVRAYCASRHNNVDAEKFVNFYTMKGWMVGKNKMKDWKAAVRTWEQGGGNKGSKIEIDNNFREFLKQNEVVDFNM